MRDKQGEAFVRFAKDVSRAFEEINKIFIRFDESVRELHERIQELEEEVASESDSPDG